ncbi:SEC-C domain-containing protein [Mesorhizobium sp. WSM4976]|uniref:YecA family protein n=1 Tax=Mesorhizobium sp. WSM4976 TaxID=3038549 RepID=UPI0024161E69|nr:SEC-C domain-containing protein [Mesorhizobium sp. WSM4976]MDG4896428.1 SEC-C domain-containing protein [Mesorhizobium sp. WSM4976]
MSTLDSKPRSEQTVFEELRELAKAPGFAHAIAYICFRDNVFTFKDKISVDDIHQKNRNEQLTRTEISTLIGLLAQGEMDLRHPGPRTMQSYIDQSGALLHELHLALMEPMMIAMRRAVEMGRENADPFNSGAAMREPIFYGGESAYDFQYAALAAEKYEADAEWLVANKGFSLRDLLAVEAHIKAIQPARLLNHRSILRRTHPDDWTFLEVFTLSIDEVAKSTKLSIDIVRAIFSSFSDKTRPRNSGFKSLGDFNTANSNPFIDIDGGQRYLLFQHYSFVESIYESPFYWMISDKTYREIAAENRGRFTEHFTAERLRSVFGHDAVYENVKFVDRSKTVKGEIDVAVAFGTRFLVIQGKSKRLTIAARKGNDQAVRADFAAAVQDAYDQCLSCSDLLLDANFDMIDSGGNIITRPKTIDRIIPLCVVSDNYPALAFQVRQFLRHVETTKRIAPLVMDVFLIDVICEMLSTPLSLISYLERRSGYHEKLVSTQELGILAYHLKSNLWVEDKFSMVMIADDFSAGLDIAMMARRAGVPGRKTPEGILTVLAKPPIANILKALEKSDQPAKFNLGLLLLTLSGKTIEFLTKGIQKIVREARADGKKHDFTVSLKGGKTGLTIHVTTEPLPICGPSLSDHVRRRKYISKAESWFGLILDPHTVSPRAGTEISSPWTNSADMEELTEGMRPDPAEVPDNATFETMTRKPGRNELCWCGSGTKYKRCHLDDDIELGRFSKR